MNWKEIKIYTTTEGIDILSGYLIMQGIRGLAIEDPADFDEFLNSTEIHWDYVEDSLMGLKNSESNVKIYLPDNIQGIEQFNALKAGLPALREQNVGVNLGRLEIETDDVDEEDWSTAWKKYYRPVHIGKHLVAVPSWENYQKQDGEIIVTLDPGMAFGTGTHETTRLCMEQLERYITKDCTMLDIGTGSGILAVTALLLGAKTAFGVDIDELSVKIANENATLNSVQDRLSLVCGDLTEKVSGKFDVICANIVADVIIRLSNDVTSFMKPDSVLLVSGIIEDRCDEVLEALQNAGLKPSAPLAENGWVSIALTLR